VLYGAALAIALLLHSIAPISFELGGSTLLLTAGGALIAVGLLASAAVVLEFRKAATAVSPLRPTTQLVRSGPYRYSRNPDYIGQTLLYVGIALALNTWWPLFLLPPTLVAVHFGVIRREERYLEAKFGQDYRDYKNQTPRWVISCSR
jgi:protein-S-isoprenylcysteine O-methyltransferase Ste14